jgi:tetratricopeptide (TPR) repeat protein
MREETGKGSRPRPQWDFVSTALLRALLICLALSMARPLWPQDAATPTFEEIERQAAEARDAHRLEEASALYREGLKLRPSWHEGTWYLGTSLYGLKRYAEARDAFRHVAISQPGNGPAWALSGMCEFELKNYPRALEYLTRAESTNLGGNEELNSLVHLRIALLENREGAFEQAYAHLIPIVATGTYPEVIEALGLTILRTPLLPSEIPEHDRDLYQRAGEALYDTLTHDKDGAARIFLELVTSYPNRPNVHNARGAFLVDSDPDEAMKEFERELEISPSDSNALFRLTTLFLKQGNPERAVAYARRFVKSSPTAVAAHRLLGEALLQSGEVAGAIAELQSAVKQEPDFAQTHFLLAEAYKRAGNKLLASKEMAEFQRLDRKQKHDFSNASPMQ